MVKKSLRCLLGLALVVAFASPAAAQQRTPDPLTRFLDGIFKPNQGQEAPAAEPQAAPQAAEPAPATAAQEPAKPKPQPKATAAKPKPPARQQSAQPKPQPTARPAAQAVASPAPAPAVQTSPVEPEVKQAAPVASQPAPRDPEPEVAEKAQATALVKVAEPPKPARATPSQVAPTPTPVATTVASATPVSPPNPASPAAALDRVNAYFNNMQQMSAYFVQKNPNGQQVEGTLSVRRPGQLHFAYAPPSTLEIVSDGRNVAIRDKKLGTNDVYPVSQTPLKFLLQDNVDLSRDTKVRDVQVGRDGMITVRFDDSATLGGTSKITLRFDSRANALRQWTVVDSQGYETTVSLSGLNVVQR